MGALRRYVLLLVVLVVRADEEPFLGQREVTFNLSELLDDDLQRPIAFSLIDFPELGSDVAERKEGVPDTPDMTRNFPAGPPMFGPRSMGPPQIPFPLARPNTNNIQAICRYSNQRPRYPRETLPSSYFGYLVRRANAINRLESWFSVCCSSGTEDERLLLCCADQAWKKSLSAFCDDEFSVKASHYHCCKQTGSNRRTCFEKASPSHLQSYVPSDHERGSWAVIPSMAEGFNFNPSSCHKQRSLIARRAITGKIPKDVFPPGRPNADNIESICANHKQRWWYVSKCLLRKANSAVAHQAKAIDVLEKGFGQCCKKRREKQSCAEMKWKMMVDDFCKDGMKADMKQFVCCERKEGEEQYNCFAAAATNPGYTPNNDSASLYEARPSLDTFCDMYRKYHSLQRQLGSWHIVADKWSTRCCSPMEEKNSACLQTQMESILDEVCSHPLWKNSGSCCRERGKSRSKCFTKYVLHKLSEEMGVNHSLRKKCRTPF
ncbi:extracellular matrix protein 1 isoform X2 [Astyanax mexicanus]|uniref:extracellular matrix protein 1 isoform X2 n=1 Tax=Astyanax mexicanus TaxID=7994 RepID=UPI0020CB0683|nr:extracellular matrix protein 1 isoform X2 [Astyanax mexicanus]